MKKDWYAQSVQEIIENLGTDLNGLNNSKAQKKLLESGANVLPQAKPDSLWVIFFRQFQSPLIYILFVAAAIIFIIGDHVDSYIVLFILFFNAFMGTIQEGKAQNTLLALQNFVSTKATVLRDGKELIIPDSEVVVGDILIIQEGEKIPADGRVILSQNLKVDEASLTGESEPVYKTSEPLNTPNLGTADQKNMVFKGTHAVSGNATVVIVRTGIETVIGKIAKEIVKIDSEIPLKTEIRLLSRSIIIAVFLISTIIFVIGTSLGESARTMFSVVVSLAISIIPEGLPVVMTLVLAVGVWRMSKRKALVKRLQAVEALGQAEIIAVDKTGTITKNEMVLEKVWTNGKTFDVSGIGYEPLGAISLNGNPADTSLYPELYTAAQVAAFCGNARLMFSEEEKLWHVAGDPTEAAMVVFAEKAGVIKNDILVESSLVSEIPFDYRQKYHATVHSVQGNNFMTVVGAPEVILAASGKIVLDGKSHDMSKEKRIELDSIFLGMSRRGLRIIAFAIKNNAPDAIQADSIKDLSFVGFYGIKDGLRPEVKEATERAQMAGIRVVMITGDHMVTARAIAQEAGIYTDGDGVLTGEEIDKMTNPELSEKILNISVFARVTPEHKLRIIEAYKQRKKIIAMTGDGVNDAMSLVAADLGVAMGKIGTEVAKEASDIILLDDNFGNIVSAVEEGRSIYKTIKKVILYLFSTSAGEVLTIAGALLLGMPLPIVAAQIIWLNFVTDGFLDVALAMEPKEKGLLKGGISRSSRYLVDSLVFRRIVVMALPMMIGTLFLFSGFYEADLKKAWTVSLTTLAVFQWFNAWNCRSDRKSIFSENPFSNPFLIMATAIVIGLQFLAVYNPLFQKLLHTTSLQLSEWLIIIPVAASIIVIEEMRKFFYRRSLAR